MRFILFLFFLFSSNLLAETERPMVYLTWQHDPTTTMTIQWISSTNKPDTLYYRERTAEPTVAWKKIHSTPESLPEDQPYLLHRVDVKKLRPDSIYCFHFGDQTEQFAFRTMPTTLTTPLRFIVGGDVYEADLEMLRKMNESAAKINPRMAIIGGDIAYATPKSKHNKTENFTRWKEFFECWTQTMRDADGCLIPMFTTIGNHEVKGRYGQSKKEALFFYAFFQKGYHSFHFGDYLHFTFLDSGHTNPAHGKQTEWLHSTLKGNRRYMHRFAAYHVSAYPTTGKFDHPSRKEIRAHWVPLFEKYHIDACFEHHDHTYKRTYALKTDKPHPEGIVYFGDGCWGATPRKPKKAPYLASTAAKQHVLAVEISKDGRTFWAVDPEGKTIDTYTQER